MIEVFRYTIPGTMGDGANVSPCMATRPFIEAAHGEVIKGSGRKIDECLVVDGGRVVQGFTGEQISYLRDLISLGPITTGGANRPRPWIEELSQNRLIALSKAGGGVGYAITPLGRIAMAQLL